MLVPRQQGDEGAEPAHFSVWARPDGEGRGREAEASSKARQRYNMVTLATDWQGMPCRTSPPSALR